MVGRVSVRNARAVALTLLMAASMLAAPAAPALAHHECEGVPGCVSVSSGTITLGRSGSVSRTLYCPTSAPNWWGASWDKSSTAVSVIQSAAGSGTLFTATNWSPIHHNTVAFYIGCSATAECSTC